MAVTTVSPRKPASPVKPAPKAPPTALAGKLAASVKPAPSKPGKPAQAPSLPSKPASKGQALAPIMRPAAATKPASEGVNAALMAEIEGLRAEIAKLQKTAAKAARANVRSVAEIVEGGAEGTKADDWRHAYHGHVIDLYQFEQKKGVVTPRTDLPLVSCLLAFPRSNDVGGRGTPERSCGAIAVHYALTEGGEYEGAPCYVDVDALGLLWPDTDE